MVFIAQQLCNLAAQGQGFFQQLHIFRSAAAVVFIFQFFARFVTFGVEHKRHIVGVIQGHAVFAFGGFFQFVFVILPQTGQLFFGYVQIVFIFLYILVKLDNVLRFFFV